MLVNLHRALAAFLQEEAPPTSLLRAAKLDFQTPDESLLVIDPGRLARFLARKPDLQRRLGLFLLRRASAGLERFSGGESRRAESGAWVIRPVHDFTSGKWEYRPSVEGRPRLAAERQTVTREPCSGGRSGA
jgi:hypothetical protein